MSSSRREAAAIARQHEEAILAFFKSLGIVKNGRMRRYKRTRRILFSIEELDDELIAPSKTPWVDIADAFGAVLKRLTIRQRQILLCRIAGTMTKAEIAQALHTSTTAVDRAFDRICTTARAKVDCNF